MTTQEILESLTGAGNLAVVRLSSSKLHFGEIIDNAKAHEHYFADLENLPGNHQGGPTRLVILIERNVQGGSTLVNASTEQRS
jgi:hypothetical protein